MNASLPLAADSAPPQLTFIAACRLPTEFGDFTLHGFQTPGGQEHIAFSVGDIGNGEAVLARIHSECLTGDALHSRRCDCGPQLQAAMRAVQAEGRGVIVYLRQEGRGIGLINKIRAYQLQDSGLDTVQANVELGLPVDARDFRLARDILRHLNVASVRLMTNNPAKIQTLIDIGIPVIERVPLVVGVNDDNRHYLATKSEKMGHMIEN